MTEFESRTYTVKEAAETLGVSTGDVESKSRRERALSACWRPQAECAAAATRRSTISQSARFRVGMTGTASRSRTSARRDS